jgi:LmbE family N-acetylglucosaminyl deacetylase
MTKRILVLAPHTDDGELGCGGTIAKMVERDNAVYYIAFSLPDPRLRNELDKASKILGMEWSIREYKVREFPQHRQEILDEMVAIANTHKPDLVICPSMNDKHQDHGVIAAEAQRAFKNCSIISYELPWNNRRFSNDLFIRLTEPQLDKKIDALKCYKSQQQRAYLNEDFIRGLARVRGTQIGYLNAECFEVIRWVI